MTSRLKIAISEQAGTLTAKFTGAIDGSADYSSIKLENAKMLVLELSEINLIDSAGIQVWVQFMSKIPKGFPIALHKTPVRIIHQMNLFAEFMANHSVKVLSFNAPYYCESCDISDDYLLEENQFKDLGKLMAAHGVKAADLPKLNCKSCGNVLEFDGFPEKYFKFLNKVA